MARRSLTDIAVLRSPSGAWAMSSRDGTTGDQWKATTDLGLPSQGRETTYPSFFPSSRASDVQASGFGKMLSWGHVAISQIEFVNLTRPPSQELGFAE